MARHRLAALAATVVLLLLAMPTASPPAIAATPTATVVVVGPTVVGGPTDTWHGSGNSDSLWTSWTRGTTTLTISFTGPIGIGLAVGEWDTTPYGDATYGLLAIQGSSCSGSHVKILEAPTYDASGSVLTFAADWSGCYRGDGSIRIGSTVPVAAIRADDDPSFGIQDVGTTAVQSVGFRNVGNVPLDLGEVTVGPSDGRTGQEDYSVTDSTCAGALDVGATCSIDIAFRPSDLGVRSATFTVTATPAALGGQVTATGWGYFPPATNDSIGTAAEIAALPYEYAADVSGATTDRLDPVCDGGYQRTVWFHYHATASEPVTISTAGSINADTVVGVYQGTAPDGLALVVCQDNVSDTDLTSLARFPAEAGTDYWIIVAQGQQGSLYDLVVRASVGAPDTSVDVGGWAASPATFYPYPDGFRDTVQTTAMLAEPAQVSIEVVSAAAPGVVLKHASLGWLEAAYGWSWDGRDDEGARVAAGAYLIRHRYQDVFGNTASFDIPVTVSSKRLVYSTTSVVKYGSKTYRRAASGTRASTSVSGTSLILRSGRGQAVALYRFRLGAARVYRWVRFVVVGKSTNGQTVRIAAWSYAQGSWEGFRTIGPAKKAWAGPRVAGSNYVNARLFYGSIDALHLNHAVTWVVYKVKATYSSAVLK